MKHIEEVPWWICDEGDYNFCSYVDTDSNYFHAEPLLKHLNPDFDNLDTNKTEIVYKYDYITLNNGLLFHEPNDEDTKTFDKISRI